MINLNELIAQKEALERQIAEAQRSARAEAIARVRAIMAEHGLTVEDLGARSAMRDPQGQRATKKVAAKYRDPSSGREWTGRGLKPKWLQSAIASGKSLTDFLIA